MFIQHFILCVFNHFLYLKSPINLRCSILGKSIHTQEEHANATQPAPGCSNRRPYCCEAQQCWQCLPKHINAYFWRWKAMSQSHSKLHPGRDWKVFNVTSLSKCSPHHFLHLTANYNCVSLKHSITCCFFFFFRVAAGRDKGMHVGYNTGDKDEYGSRV